MISSLKLKESTGLSSKTLTRWWQRGFIPKPEIGLHPSGRGKVGYWPDWVEGRCLAILALRKQGLSLPRAVDFLNSSVTGDLVMTDITVELSREQVETIVSLVLDVLESSVTGGKPLDRMKLFSLPATSFDLDLEEWRRLTSFFPLADNLRFNQIAEGVHDGN